MDSKTTGKQKEILIRKASGEVEVFDTTKLERSLRNAGADAAAIKRIVSDIEDWVISGSTTKQIYTRAFSILRRERTVAAIRYKLKRAIMELGPSGYPFEKYIGELFRKQGYETEVGVVVEGYCITHEMDVIATKDKQQYLVECKYHVNQGNPVSVQVPLYVRSRVDDITRKRQELAEYKGVFFTGWIVSNTRFTEDSIQYAKCSGLRLMAWDYPQNRGLKDVVERLGLYPITILHQLTKKEKQHLLNKGIVTCTQLRENSSVLDEFPWSEKKIKTIKEELEDIRRGTPQVI